MPMERIGTDLNSSCYRSLTLKKKGNKFIKCSTCKRVNPVRFTLIELLVVIAIIAILASILMPALSSARERSKTSSCANSLKQLGIGFASYLDSHNDWYPYYHGYSGGSAGIVAWREQLGDAKCVPYRRVGKSKLLSDVLRCPGHEYKYADAGRGIKTGRSYDYMGTYVANNVSAEWTGWGTGKSNANANGCKSQHLYNPSSFVLLAEKRKASDTAQAKFTDHYFDRYANFHSSAKPIVPSNEWVRMIDLSAHNDRANYLCADGHVVNWSFSEVRWGNFCILGLKNPNSSLANKTYLDGGN